MKDAGCVKTVIISFSARLATNKDKNSKVYTQMLIKSIMCLLKCFDCFFSNNLCYISNSI